MTDGAYTKYYAKMIEESRFVSKEATNIYTMYQRSKEIGVWPAAVAAREFVLVNYFEHHQDGTISDTAFSERTKENLVEPKPGAIRADCYIGGWTLRPISEGKETEMTIIIEADIKGMIPKSVIKFTNKEQAM